MVSVMPLTLRRVGTAISGIHRAIAADPKSTVVEFEPQVEAIAGPNSRPVEFGSEGQG